MKYTYKDGNFRKGDILIITVDRRVNIYLVDSINFQRYKKGNIFEYYTSQSSSSPYNITVPSTGYWYIVLDLDGGTGILNYSIKVLK